MKLLLRVLLLFLLLGTGRGVAVGGVSAHIEEVSSLTTVEKTALKKQYEAWKMLGVVDEVSEIFNNELSLINSGLENINHADDYFSLSEGLNNFWNSKGYTNPPYKSNTPVCKFKLNENTIFVRVYDGIHSTEYGQFLMKLEDITDANGSFLSATDIKNKFALEYLPLYIAEAEIPANTVMNCGIAGRIEGWGDGGGLQFDLNGAYVGSFHFLRNLPN